jgi:hypothetical protein
MIILSVESEGKGKGKGKDHRDVVGVILTHDVSPYGMETRLASTFGIPSDPEDSKPSYVCLSRISVQTSQLREIKSDHHFAGFSLMKEDLNKLIEQSKAIPKDMVPLPTGKDYKGPRYITDDEIHHSEPSGQSPGGSGSAHARA